MGEIALWRGRLISFVCNSLRSSLAHCYVSGDGIRVSGMGGSQMRVVGNDLSAAKPSGMRVSNDGVDRENYRLRYSFTHDFLVCLHL